MATNLTLAEKRVKRLEKAQRILSRLIELEAPDHIIENQRIKVQKLADISKK